MQSLRHYEALSERRNPTVREAKLHTTLELHSLDKDISLLFEYDNTLDPWYVRRSTKHTQLAHKYIYWWLKRGGTIKWRNFCHMHTSTALVRLFTWLIIATTSTSMHLAYSEQQGTIGQFSRRGYNRRSMLHHTQLRLCPYIPGMQENNTSIYVNIQVRIFFLPERR